MGFDAPPCAAWFGLDFLGVGCVIVCFLYCLINHILFIIITFGFPGVGSGGFGFRLWVCGLNFGGFGLDFLGWGLGLMFWVISSTCGSLVADRG